MRPAEMPLDSEFSKRGIGQIGGRGYEMFEQGAQLGRFHVLGGDVSAAGHLQSRRQIGQHHAQRFLVLRNVVRQGAGHRVLQQALVGDQALAVDRFHLRRIEIHRHDADQHQHAEDDVQNRNAGWKGQFQGQSGSAATFAAAGDYRLP